MGANTVNSSSAWPRTGWLKSMATYGRRFLEPLKTLTFSVVSAVLAFFVLLLILLPDIVNFRRRQSKTQAPAPNTRLLPIPTRQGSEIFAIMPDGERVKIDTLAAKTHAMAWVDAVTGVAVFEQTRIRE